MGEALAWGKRRYAERGIVNLALIPYGYKKSKNGQWEIVDEEAAIVKMIYRMFSDGMGYTRIAKELASRGIISPGGNKHWIIGTVKSILTHEAYIGNYLYQKGYTKDSIEKKATKNTGELPQYLIVDRHESIIPLKTWEDVQKLVKQKSLAYENRKKKPFKKRYFSE
jgi:site-specific DNA recombinase